MKFLECDIFCRKRSPQNKNEGFNFAQASTDKTSEDNKKDGSSAGIVQLEVPKSPKIDIQPSSIIVQPPPSILQSEPTKEDFQFVEPQTVRTVR